VFTAAAFSVVLPPQTKQSSHWHKQPAFQLMGGTYGYKTHSGVLPHDDRRRNRSEGTRKANPPLTHQREQRVAGLLTEVSQLQKFLVRNMANQRPALP
jgi:hypothetical protein